MARTKRPNYALGEDVPTEVHRSKRISRIVYEDPDPSENDREEDNDGDDGSSRTVTNDEYEGIQPMLPMEMYFEPREYVKKIKISTRCYITAAVELLLNGLKYPLEDEERSWFLNHPQFKHCFHMHKDRNHKVMGMWLLLLRTAVTEKKKEAWFIVNGVPIRYGLREHALISGLSCRSYPPNHEELGSMVFVEKYFGAGSKIRYSDVKEKLLKMRYSPDRLNMAVLFFLSNVIIGQSKVGEDATCVDRFFQRAVSDLHLCKTFPWGRLSFDNNMQEIQQLHGAGEKAGDENILVVGEHEDGLKDKEIEEQVSLDGDKGGEDELHGAGEKGGDEGKEGEENVPVVEEYVEDGALQEREGEYEVHGAEDVGEDVSMMEEGGEEDVPQISMERCSTVVVKDGKRQKELKRKPDMNKTYGRRKTRSQVPGVEEGGEPSKRTKKLPQHLMPPFTEEKGRGKRPRKN